MNIDKISFIKSVLKIIACTPNRNFDEADYCKRVSVPTKKLREIRENIESISFNKQFIKNIIISVSDILAAKKLDSLEYEERISELIQFYQLDQLFGGDEVIETIKLVK